MPEVKGKQPTRLRAERSAIAGVGWAVDPLEHRRMMANSALAVALDAGILRISGTSEADFIAVNRAGTAWHITNGTWATSLKGAVSSLLIKAGAGNDRVELSASVFQPAKIYGNSGNDTLIGGVGADSLYGHAGDDSLVGGGGNDLLVAIGGGNRDTLVGGLGEDSFWLDSGASERTPDVSASETRNAAVHRIGAFQNVRGQVIGKELTDARTNLPDPRSNHAGGKWANFGANPLFSTAGPTMDDVRQGALGDCYLQAPLSAIASKNPARLREAIADLGDGTYAVQLYRGGSKVFYRVDADLPVYSWSSSTLMFAQQGTQKSIWGPLIEKAYALHRTSAQSYESIGNGGWFDEGFSALGGNSSDRFADEFATPADMLRQIETSLAAGHVVAIGTGQVAGGSMLVSGHGYTVVRIVKNANGTRSVVLRNPWAVDGGAVASGDAKDGYLTLTAAQLKTAATAFSTALV